MPNSNGHLKRQNDRESVDPATIKPDNRTKFVQPWPIVEGSGTLTENMLEITYRSASGLPEHDFYFAECRFQMGDGGEDLQCQFTQRADPQSSALSTGQATGTIVTHAIFAGQEKRLKELVPALQ